MRRSALAVKALANRSLEVVLSEKGFSESKKDDSPGGRSGQALSFRRVAAAIAR